MSHSSEIICSEIAGKDGYLGHFLLNRPQALNALSQSMIAIIHQQLSLWQKDPRITAVIIEGAGDRAFCAGGDIRAVYQHKDNIAASEHFFHLEYDMNKKLYHFDKPYIAFLDGITMGGGAGVSLHGSHRIATERLVFAMPETGIGFFPDVGASYFLSRCPHKIGYYLGLTGHRIEAADTQYLGFTTHVISSKDKKELITALTNTPLAQQAFKQVSETIAAFSQDVGTGPLENSAPNIESCFSTPTIEELFIRLKDLNTTWSQSSLKTLTQRSPTSLKVTLEQLNRATAMDFDAIMAMELGIAFQFLRTADFYEGIRAMLIDKDKTPRWQPPQIEAVTPAHVNAFFRAY